MMTQQFYFFTYLFLALGVLGVLAMPSSNAQAQAFNNYYQQIAELNRIPPTQNPRFIGVEDLEDRTITDSTERVIGTLQDITIHPEGAIDDLRISFDRLRLSQEVFIDLAESRTVPLQNGYRLSVDQERLEEIYPALLAQIETAAGNEDVFSMLAIRGARVEATNHRILGTVEDVIFDSDGRVALGVLLNVSVRGLKGETVVLPFESIDFISSSNRHPDLIVSRVEADTIIEYVRDHRR